MGGEEERDDSTLQPQTETALMGKNQFSLKGLFSSTFSPFLDLHMSKPRCPGEAEFSSIAPLEHQPCPSPQLLGHKPK